ncbi:hypothetical protein M1N85_00220 [Dehalococcoidia bacterium]|nr:hypothetical protein [Dehalococcoidia bacterium]
MQIDPEFIKRYDIETYILEERLNSKKNLVHKVRCMQSGGDEKIVIVKAYKDPTGSMQKELGMLLGLARKGLAVPEVYHVGENAIIMEYLAGSNLLDIIYLREELAKSGKGYDSQADWQLIGDVFYWLRGFYKLAKEVTGREIIFGDVNLRNFIMVNGKVYGLDFEDYCEGQPEKDAGRFCAFVLTYNPAFTDWKMGFIQKTYKVLVKSFGYNGLLVEQEMGEELGAIKKRRGRLASMPELWRKGVKCLDKELLAGI